MKQRHLDLEGFARYTGRPFPKHLMGSYKPPRHSWVKLAIAQSLMLCALLLAPMAARAFRIPKIHEEGGGCYSMQVCTPSIGGIQICLWVTTCL